MEQEYKKEIVIIKVKHSWLRTKTELFKLVQVDYYDTRIEIINVHGETISEFPFIWNGFTLDEAVQRFKYIMQAIGGTCEVIE